ncbi:uncharacterized protein SCHCODRAFT_01158920 [Schizophyllum commune H4-8]|nr:uncharacterized protein SCHCODRAFT_01158920 [Schizophyllum commune H4-8]KAI5888281.1 hypothetical protein SCHCODRAFT_01158920 [Schizophyllum commune H4-8]
MRSSHHKDERDVAADIGIVEDGVVCFCRRASSSDARVTDPDRAPSRASPPKLACCQAPTTSAPTADHDLDGAMTRHFVPLQTRSFVLIVCSHLEGLDLDIGARSLVIRVGETWAGKYVPKFVRGYPLSVEGYPRPPKTSRAIDHSRKLGQESPKAPRRSFVQAGDLGGVTSSTEPERLEQSTT